MSAYQARSFERSFKMLAMTLSAALSAGASLLHAQTPPAIVHVAETTLTADALAPAVTALTAESLRVRPTPSAALDRTAEYLVTQLQALGFQPGLKQFQTLKPVWMLRYPLPGQQQLDYTTSYLAFETAMTSGGRPVVTEDGQGRRRWASMRLDHTAHLATEITTPVIAQRALGGFGEDRLGRADVASSRQAVLVAGPQNAASLQAAATATPLADCVVVYVPQAGGDTAAEHRAVRWLYATARGVVVVRPNDSVAFAATVAAGRRQPVRMVESYLRDAQGARRWPWAIDVQPEAVAGVLAAVGVDVPALWAATVPIARRLETLQIKFEANIAPASPSLLTAPVVAGLLPGTDTAAAREGLQEYLIIATPMDTPLTLSGVPDTARGTTAGASVNLAGLLALARAFSQPWVRPRRSVLMVATSGEAGTPVAWGSHFLAEIPSVLNDDLFGIATFFLAFDAAGGGDTVVIDGGAALDMLPSPAWLAAGHPELGLTVLEAGTLPTPGSSIAAFAGMLMPSLLVHRSHTSERPAVADEPTARVLRYLFYVGSHLANAERFPTWSARGRASLRSPGP